LFRFLSFIILTVISLVFGDRFISAVAAEIECNALLGKTLKKGEKPKVTYDKSWGIAYVESSEGTCKEPIEVWRGRRLADIPVKTVDEMPPSEGGAHEAGKAPVKLAPTAKSSSAAVPAPLKSKPKPPPCDKELEDFWKEGSHIINGVGYWLFKVHTVDIDNDGVIDDIGFRLKAQGKEDLVMNYFGGADNVPAKSFPSLKLADESMISRICFGFANFNDPTPPQQPQQTQSAEQAPQNPFQVPDLAAEMKKKEGGDKKEEGKPEAPSETSGSGFGLALWIIIGVVLAGGVGGGGWYFVTHAHGKRKKHKRINKRFEESSDNGDNKDS